jgi:WD40 repeat protein
MARPGQLRRRAVSPDLGWPGSADASAQPQRRRDPPDEGYPDCYGIPAFKYPNIHGGGEVLLRTLSGHHGPVYALAIAPDGTWLASAGEDGAVQARAADGGANETIHI